MSLWVSFGVFLIFIICIYCYARTGYLRSRILSLDIPVFDTPLYIYNLALVYPCSLRYRSECCAFELRFLFTPFSTKAPSYNQSFILLYVLNFYFRGRNTLPSLNYDLSIRLCMVGCYIMVSEQFVPVEPEGWTDYASVHSLYVCYVLLVYLLDIIGINVHEHAFGTLKH